LKSSDPSQDNRRDRTSKSWRQLIYESDLPAIDKSVLLAYADFDRFEKGVAIYPSYAYIAWLTGWKLTTVKNAVSRLCDRGVLVPCGHVLTNQPRGRVVRYRIDVTKLPPRTAWTRNDRSRHTASVDSDRSRLAASVPRPSESSTEAVSLMTEAVSPIDRSRLAATDLYVRDQDLDRTDDRARDELIDKAPAQDLAQDLLARFAAVTYQGPWKPTPKELGHARELIASYSNADLEIAIDAFASTHDQWVIQQGYPFAIFATQVTRWLNPARQRRGECPTAASKQPATGRVAPVKGKYRQTLTRAI
jgi:hypothetical protein